MLNAYAGWSNVNYVLNNVKNPVRTLKIAGPLGLSICAVLYLLANISYFACVSYFCFGEGRRLTGLWGDRAATKDQILHSGDDGRKSVLQERVWCAGAEGADRVRRVEVRPWQLRDVFTEADFCIVL